MLVHDVQRHQLLLEQWQVQKHEQVVRKLQQVVHQIHLYEVLDRLREQEQVGHKLQEVAPVVRRQEVQGRQVGQDHVQVVHEQQEEGKDRLQKREGHEDCGGLGLHPTSLGS